MDPDLADRGRLPEAHRGGRQHRFMESADINAAFGELFKCLRTSIRRGLTSEGQVYAIEMDACIPGELLGTTWVPPITRGIDAADSLADPARRRTMFEGLLAEQRPESLFAYVRECPAAGRPRVLYLEILSSDGGYAAEYPIRPGSGWHRRNVARVPHRRLETHRLA